jgi:hypothetical protein
LDELRIPNVLAWFSDMFVVGLRGRI